MGSFSYFFSPQPTPKTTNEYIISFYEKLAERVTVVNYNKKPVSASLDIFRYVFKSDVMVLNWPEDIMHLRFGILQIIISFLGLVIFRIRGGKIVWVCHNRESHFKRFKLLRNFARKFFATQSQNIIVHSEDALKHFKRVRHKVIFMNHPVYEKFHQKTEVNDAETIDVLIWGNITPYKGLSAFIENYKKCNVSFGVTIIGKANKDYYKHLTELAAGSKVSIIDHFLSEEELYQYFQKSKIILLPYLDNDTFSSGSLIHSLNSSKVIIGPSLGNFIDLQKTGACLTYDDYQGLFNIVGELLSDDQKYKYKLKELQQGIERYYLSNTWDKFIDNLLLIVSEKKHRDKMVATILEC
ncbi:hypothetical protein OCK74_04070 [Chitinophagaceae bacterium LB-8]|jgi:glycosyltransferase involved in cell wall biosynthesis|uniref:Glycosyltransferase n=1 Tax=Paraflavisolibacter caeni TaxID=2982496 RepID=A0A9X3BF56_9BACT|nr:hypothetical protein [Paraflavisolibacter caeni]MCU7548274.1 hypothetical protein [Paraflavisolibacter caeni]